MEHYPDIQRHQGTLFFIPHGDRAAIAISIERLIDLLDAAEGDPDLEPYLSGFDHQTDDREEDSGDSRECDFTDDEPSLAAIENHIHVNLEPRAGDQTYWGYGSGDDREDDGDDLEDGADAEPSLGSPNDYACRSQEQWAQDRGTFFNECEVENEAGGDILDEPHDDDELDQNGDEQDYSGSEDEWSPYKPDALYDGTGAIIAAELLLRAKPRREPYSEIIGVRHHQLEDGSVFTTLVPR